MKKPFFILILSMLIIFASTLGVYAVLQGDVDGDGKLTANDSAIILSKALNGSYKMPVDNTYLADLSGDGRITAEDSAIVLQRVLNNIEYSTEPTTDVVNIKISLDSSDEDVIIKLNDSNAAKNFAKMLPLTLDFKDYNNTEKIAYLNSQLDVSGTSKGETPTTGDFMLYEPWGNLVIYYKPFEYSADLVSLGVVESGLDLLTKQTGNFKATIDLADNKNPTAPKALMVYFSATGTTKAVAEKIASVTNSDVFEIQPKIPYTAADLKYTSDCRANSEQNNPSARPEINGFIENIDDYDTIYLGYPIWWGNCPKIIYTFLEAYDLSGKTIVPFCTSGSTGINQSESTVKSLTKANIKNGSGRRFNSDVSEDEIKQWLNDLK